MIISENQGYLDIYMSLELRATDCAGIAGLLSDEELPVQHSTWDFT